MDRNCGECFECCFIPEIGDIKKPCYQKCFYQSDEQLTKRCIIYEARPKDCEKFWCSWARGFGAEEDRPDLNGVMISINSFNNGTWIFVIERVKDAVLTTAKDMIIQIVKEVNFPAIVSSYESKPPNDFGDFTIVKESLKHRCTKMIDDLVIYLDEEKQIGLYKLRK